MSGNGNCEKCGKPCQVFGCKYCYECYKSEQPHKNINEPTCKVHGMIQPGAMCGHIIVGLKHCGFGGDCEHKSIELYAPNAER